MSPFCSHEGSRWLHCCLPSGDLDEAKGYFAVDDLKNQEAVAPLSQLSSMPLGIRPLLVAAPP